MQYDFQAMVSQAEKDFNFGGNTKFKFQEGDNKLRILSPTLPYQSTYKGRETTKFVGYILDRKDGKVKVAFLPYTIIKAITALQLSDDYKFDEVPMPYDINVIAKKAGTIEVEYQVIPARKETFLTDQEFEALQAKTPIEQFIEKLRGVQQQTQEIKEKENKEEEQNVMGQMIEEIPFS